MINTNTRTTSTPRSHDVMSNIAMIMHKLAQLKATQLGEVADEQEEILAHRKEITNLKNELKEMAGNGYLSSAELSQIQTQAKQLGIELPDLTALKNETGGGYSLEAGTINGTTYAEDKVAEMQDKLSSVYENFDEAIEISSDSDSVRTFKMNQLFNAFSNYEASASKSLSNAKQLTDRMLA